MYVTLIVCRCVRECVCLCHPISCVYVYASTRFALGGSGSSYIYGLVDSLYREGMNKEEWYGHDLFVITFSEAVKRGLLVDYKVIVLSVEETHVSRRLQGLLADENN
ncbi:hypothetical protein EON63_22225, partial [archaeon]